jgi:hypothetical protein
VGRSGVARAPRWGNRERHAPYDVEAIVAGRAGCDIAPIDPAPQQGRLVLSSFVWADQRERLDLLQRALEVAARLPVTVEQADGPSWLERQLAVEREGVATVVFHSFVWQFVDDDGRKRIRQALEQAARRASPESPLAWLRMEGLDAEVADGLARRAGAPAGGRLAPGDRRALPLMSGGRSRNARSASRADGRRPGRYGATRPAGCFGTPGRDEPRASFAHPSLYGSSAPRKAYRRRPSETARSSSRRCSTFPGENCW